MQRTCIICNKPTKEIFTIFDREEEQNKCEDDGDDYGRAISVHKGECANALKTALEISTKVKKQIILDEVGYDPKDPERDTTNKRTTELAAEADHIGYLNSLELELGEAWR